MPGVADGLQVDAGRDRHAPGVHLEDLAAAGQVGRADRDPAVEPAGPQQRRVEDLGRLVAASTTTPSLPVKPSISVRIWLSVCSRSSLPPSDCAPPRAGRSRPARR
jgi:hypothetical protein